MHTAFCVDNSMFTVTIDGKPSTREALLGWEVRDRLGVVIDRPVGALGAGLFIFLAITAWFDMPSRNRRGEPSYPDVYLFHLGGPWGDLSHFDFFPDHKDVQLGTDPTELLRQINSRGITHLLIPEKPRRKIAHRFSEPEAARDRLKQCLVYGVEGEAKHADVRLSTTDGRVLEQYDGALEVDTFVAHLKPGIDGFVQGFAHAPGMVPVDQYAILEGDVQHIIDNMTRRLYERQVDHPDHIRARQRIDKALSQSRLEEGYRRVSVDEALDMLG